MKFYEILYNNKIPQEATLKASKLESSLLIELMETKYYWPLAIFPENLMSIDVMAVIPNGYNTTYP